MNITTFGRGDCLAWLLGWPGRAGQLGANGYESNFFCFFGTLSMKPKFFFGFVWFFGTLSQKRDLLQEIAVSVETSSKK